MQAEDFTTMDNLGMMNGKAIVANTDNLHKPAECIPNLDQDAQEGLTIPRPSYVFGAVSQMKLLIACEAVRYYEMVGRELTPGIMTWSILKNFELQLQALQFVEIVFGRL